MACHGNGRTRIPAGSDMGFNTRIETGKTGFVNPLAGRTNALQHRDKSRRQGDCSHGFLLKTGLSLGKSDNSNKWPFGGKASFASLASCARPRHGGTLRKGLLRRSPRTYLAK